MDKDTIVDKQYSIKTFGCKVNTYDSSLIQKTLMEKTWVERPLSDSAVKVHIVNTCAVTAEAVKEASRWVRHYRKKNPQSQIVITGCAAQVETEKFSDLEEVDLVVANSHKSELAEILSNSQRKKEKIFKSSIFKKNSLGAEGQLESAHTRLFLKIQDGCDSFCTFCIIPFARGKSRSIPPADLVRSVQKHYEEGVREVVLTGVHIGDYRIPGEEKKGLAELIRILLQQTKMPRIRLSSLEPIELSNEILELFTSPRVCPHFHLSVQSADSDVLRRMKRKYTEKDVENSLFRIHKICPLAFVGMDFIAGFAGESQKQFEDAYLRLKDWPWTKMHVFPYSPRRYTYAEKAYAAWPRSLVMKRASLLRHLSEERVKKERQKQVGSIKSVLPLRKKEQIGISRDYWTVNWSDADFVKINRNGTSPEFRMYVRSVNEKNGYLKGDFVK
ncbi:MAG: tRNA (N(6)-L-threonylcarbamoyladenosine(37)-C(2))-methylthiotransferase MtaB [Bdellovibrionales bacterium]|nr:tRNA (N(6)-L-threonylcarbamoyladenosine(37)-C(2))-methylthiotransferase MtaB [Bdellovibrionales bacterium]